jgi:hypothetical protein
LSNVGHLDRLLSGPHRVLSDLLADKPVLDIGCADGDLAFFLESLGARVHAIDHPVTNHNGMRGVRALKEALGSKLEIATVDLDRQFTLPSEQYGLALFLGALYHLKNPFYALETIARHSSYCLLSTRIARMLPDRKTSVADVPVGYLVAEDELNADNSNYWIFSEAGLRRLLERAQWQVLDWMTTGDTLSSDPVSPAHDERVFCLVRSTFGLRHLQLLEGWHEPEEGGWRWTERRFRAEVHAANARTLSLRFFVPQAVVQRTGVLEMRVQINGVELQPARYSTEGIFVYAEGIPRNALNAARGLVEFELSGALPPDESDGRERGVIVDLLRIE